MNIFVGRPGLAAGVLAVGAILSAAFLTLPLNIVLIAVSLLALAVCGTLTAFGVVKPYRSFSTAAVLLAVIFVWLGGIVFFYRAAPEAEELCGENAYVHATVAEREVSGDYYTQYIIRLRSVNGVPYDGKAALVCEYSSDLQVGYEFVLRSADVDYVLRLAPSEALSFVADKVFLRITSHGDADCHILSEGNYTFSDRLSSLNSYLSAKLKNTVRGDGGRLAAAMLLGDRDALTAEMYRDFSRAGISHYLAVSGLHVSIITAIVSLFLVNLRLRRGLRNLLLLLFALGYLLILGFPVSAVRSVAMLTVVFLAYSLGDNSDTLNSLGIAAVLILAISPCSVFDKSFVLSFCATLGIAAFIPVLTALPRKLEARKEKDGKRKEKKRRRLAKILLALVGAIMTTLCAVSATLLVSALFFGETSAYSLISNLLLLPVGAPMLACSLLCLIFGDVPYLGEALQAAVRLCSEYILEVAGRVSDIRGASVSLVSRGAITVALTFTVILALALIVKVKHKEVLLLVPAIYPLVLALISLVAVLSLPETAQLTCISTGKYESVFLQSGTENAIVDISDGSYSRFRSIAYIAHEQGATEFDTVMLTHYHNRHISALSRFAAEEKVRLVILPYPTTDDEAWMMVQLADILRTAGCSVRVASPEGELEIVGGITLSYPRITRIERSTQPVTYLSFTDGKQRVTYLSSSAWEDGLYFADELAVLAAESDAVVIGAHGPVNKEIFDLPLDSAAEVCVFDAELACILHRDSSLPPERTKVNAAVTFFAFGEGE